MVFKSLILCFSYIFGVKLPLPFQDDGCKGGFKGCGQQFSLAEVLTGAERAACLHASSHWPLAVPGVPMWHSVEVESADLPARPTEFEAWLSYFLAV